MRPTPQAERDVDRLRIVILSIGTLFLPWIWTDPRVWPWMASALLAVAWIYALLLFWWPPRSVGLRRSHLTAAADGAVTLLWVLATGGAESPAFSLILVAAFAAAMRFTPRPTWVISALYSVGYLLVLVPRNQLAGRWGDALMRVGVLVGGTYLAAVISSRMVRQAVEKERLERERSTQLARRELLLQLEEAQRLAHVGSFQWQRPAATATWSAETYRILGVDPHSFQPTLAAWRTLVHPEDRRQIDASIGRLLKEGRPFDVEHRVVRPSGETRWVHDRAEAVRNDRGKVVILRGTTLDITEQRSAEESKVQLAEERVARAAAEEALQIRDEFLTVAAHELRTPLTTLKLQVQSILRLFTAPGADPSVMKEKLLRVDRQTGHLVGLIESLLDVSRIAEGRLQLHPTEADLAELARRSVERFADQGARVGSPITLVEEGPVPGRWDPLRVEQAIDNLLSNAIKYGAGRPVQLEVGRRGEFGFIVVRDQGITIPKEAQERIFGRFERAAPTRHFGGLGLGLWLVREVVEAMGGRIEVASNPGEGSAFTLVLPLRPEVAEAVQISPSALH